MESASSESNQQKETAKIKETIVPVPPEVIRPLARALLQSSSFHIEAIKKEPEVSAQAQQAAEELNSKLLNLLQAKEVKIIEDIPDSPDDISTIGIECSPETESNIVIPPSTTIIQQPLLSKLGLALQDYLMVPAISVGQSTDAIISHFESINAILEKVTEASTITITNTAEESLFQDLNNI